MEDLERPLRTPSDVHGDVEKNVGAKTAEKIKEILATASLGRVAAMAQNVRQQAVSLFMSIWGVGEVVAREWYFQHHAHTLEDIQQKVKEGKIQLTQLQHVGLKYYSDFQRKTPRHETELSERILRKLVFDLAEGLGATDDTEKTYCCATGSYRRGAAESGDIDILIVLPPSLSHFSCSEFLYGVLSSLLRQNFLLDEMEPLSIDRSMRDKSSFMSVCRPPGSSHVRRIDIKAYSPSARVMAVNFFSNSMEFCRATRLWAKRAVPQLAKKHHPLATGFKIGDTELVLLSHKPAGKYGATTDSKFLSGTGSGDGGSNGGYHRPAATAITSGTSVQSSNANGSRKRSREGRSPRVWQSAAQRRADESLGVTVEVKDETELFEMLGLSYVPYHMRKFS